MKNAADSNNPVDSVFFTVRMARLRHTEKLNFSMNIIFDIGNVICDWDPVKLIKQVNSDPGMQKKMLEQVFRHSDWHELDKGLLTVEEAIVNACRRGPFDVRQVEALYRGTPASLIPRPGIIDTIQDLHARGFPLYVLSNMQAHAWEYLYSRYSFWSVFRGIVVSCAINMIKPDPEIFRYILHRYDLVPGETVFLDDMIENINAASALGLEVIHVVNGDDYIARLYKAIGIEREAASG